MHRGAFQGTGITGITIPASVTSIGEGAFYYCSNLGTVTFAEGSNLTSIGGSAFQGTGITGITIPASVTSIGGSAFRGTGITGITIPASVTSIGGSAFYCCSNLGTVTFAEGSNLTSIGEHAFNGAGITSIVIPASVTSIGYLALDNCNSLVTVYYCGTQEQWSNMSGRDAYWAGDRENDINIVFIKDVPEGKTLTYNGSEQTGVEAGTGYTLNGTTSATAAGSYKATAKLEEGYVWSDGTTADKTIDWTINKAAAKVTAPTGKTFTYDGTEKTGVAAGSNYTLTGTVKATGAGSYTVKATFKEDDNYAYTWTDGTTDPKTITWKINKAAVKVTAPTGKTFTYDGTEKTGVAAGSNYTLTGTVKATGAGSYSAKASLKTSANYSYTWTDGTTAAKTITWKINKAAVKVTAPTGKTFTYDGTEKTGVAAGSNYTLTGTVKATGAGSYTAKASLKTDANHTYTWTDGTTAAKTITWKINKAAVKVTAPAGKTFTYDGKEKTGVSAGSNYALTGTVKATVAGSYSVKASLKTSTNYSYTWTDGTTAAKTITWKINKAAVKVTAPTGKTFTYDGKEKTGVAAGSNYALTGTAKATGAGSYSAKASLKTNANYSYTWTDGTTAARTITWKIDKAKNPLTVKAKKATVKYSKLKKNNQTLAVGKVISFTKEGEGKMTYAKVSGNKKITIKKTTGKVTVGKDLKKGTYKVRVKVKAAGNANYKASAWKAVTFSVQVK